MPVVVASKTETKKTKKIHLPNHHDDDDSDVSRQMRVFIPLS